MRPKLVKVCGITRREDALTCLDAGADALGFIFHSESPRNLSILEYDRCTSGLCFGETCKVAVAVAPNVSRVEELLDAGFDKFQFHFSSDHEMDEIRECSELVGSQNLWLAPRLQKTEDFPIEWLSLASVILVDAYSKEVYGGSGKKADWEGFGSLRAANPCLDWMLAGGLGPENLQEAILCARPDGVDLNSGLESHPGVKDPEKIQAVFSLLEKQGN